MRFPAKKKAGCPKARAISRQEKIAFSTPVGLPWDFPPVPQSLYERTYVRTYGRTLTSQPKFLASMGYQIFLSMVLLSVLLQLNKRFMTYAAYLKFKRP